MWGTQFSLEMREFFISESMAPHMALYLPFPLRSFLLCPFQFFILLLRDYFGCSWPLPGRVLIHAGSNYVYLAISMSFLTFQSRGSETPIPTTLVAWSRNQGKGTPVASPVLHHSLAVAPTLVNMRGSQTVTDLLSLIQTRPSSGHKHGVV